jgi:putative flippase GtrA
MKKNKLSRINTSINRYSYFAKFILVGLSGTVLDYSLLFVLKSWDWPTVIANICSASLGMFNNFYWNRQWTFSKPQDKSYATQFVQYLIVSLIGLGINTFVLVTLEEPFEVIFPNAQMGFILAKVIATGTGFIWNYIANMNWTFRGGQTRVAE